MEHDSTSDKLNTAYIEEISTASFGIEATRTCGHYDFNEDVYDFYLEASNMEMSIPRCAAAASFQMRKCDESGQLCFDCQTPENFDLLKDSCFLYASDYDSSETQQSAEQYLAVISSHPMSEMSDLSSEREKTGSDLAMENSKNLSLAKVTCLSVYNYLSKKVTKWLTMVPSKKSSTLKIKEIKEAKDKPTRIYTAKSNSRSLQPTSYVTTAYLLNSKSNFFAPQYQQNASPLNHPNLQSNCGDFVFYQI